ncbi:hypothetical protein [Brevibacterium aurantiacum]|uniref:Uncharacterized protein n=1 Tax=Brevibacterium aurantiacum TaxID=273384 RepID=A0A2A3ZUJ0_BREAU|nr:hypothetical protein [Brevibacterium aurantiacum]PCC55249.1 hypothetical protein CIK59_00275 [Brevibacterium aurantiacum]
MPAISELIHERADGTIGASTALCTAAMFPGTSTGPQIGALLAPGGFVPIGIEVAGILAAGSLVVG